MNLVDLYNLLFTRPRIKSPTDKLNNKYLEVDPNLLPTKKYTFCPCCKFLVETKYLKEDM